MGASVSYCSVAGRDPESQQAIDLLNSIGVTAQRVICDDSRRTLVKTRVMAGTHVITRFDMGTQTPIGDHLTQQICDFISDNYSSFDAVVLSDYDKGIFTARLIEVLQSLQKKHSLFIAIDSKRLDFFQGLRPAFVKPNYNEAVKLLGLTTTFTNRVQQLELKGRELENRTGSGLVAVTLDSDGSLIFENGKAICYKEAPKITTPHVAGAGDTYLSAFVLSYKISNDACTSTDIATAAACIAIGKEDTSACTITELKTYFQDITKCIQSRADLLEVCREARAKGQKLVFTNGCFDILHSGHVTYLHCAKKLGDILIVGINTDESIRRIKGDTRPINSLPDRIQVLAGLSAVDYVIPFGDTDDDTPKSLITSIQPHFFVKGGDYTRDMLPEAETVEKFGGKIVILPHIPDHSTTSIIRKITYSTDEVQTPLEHG
jgi:D-beta-D-heptose 7-phosphate kinase/D-beta-D-heptose 1-phosphate adenosyltransferase